MDLTLTHDTIFNPDGSGKVSIRWEGDPPSADLQPGAFIASEVGNGRGIDAWKDLSCTVDGGRLVFQATVYFKSAAELRFFCQGFHANVLDLETSTDDAGNFTVRTPGPGPEIPPESGDEKALLAKLAEERPKFAMAKDFLEGMMGGLVCVGSVKLPGKVGRVKHWKKGPADTVKTRFEGKALLQLLDRLMTDDELALKLLRSGKEGPEALLALLGEQGPLEAVTTGKLAPQFDYEAEVAAAKEEFAAMAGTLNLPKPPELAPPMQNVRIVATKLVREADGDRELCPMGQNYASFSMTILGDAPEGTIKADEGRMEAAITDTGVNLVPEDDWGRRISFPKLTKDRRNTFFDVDLKLGDGPVDGFKEIRGTMSLVVSSGTEDVDLGLRKLEADEEGKELGARIQRVEVQEDRTSFDLRLQVPMERLEALRVVPPKGGDLAIDQNGYSSSGDECTLSYTIPGALPKKFKLVARVAKDLQTLVVPFEIRDVDLLGRPRA